MVVTFKFRNTFQEVYESTICVVNMLNTKIVRRGYKCRGLTKRRYDNPNGVGAASITEKSIGSNCIQKTSGMKYNFRNTRTWVLLFCHLLSVL